MSFPAPGKFNLVVAATNADGIVDFLDVPGPATMEVPGAVSGAWFWEVSGGHSISNFGDTPEAVNIAKANGSTFGVTCFPARSAGKLDAAAANHNIASAGHNGDPAMHATESIDYEIVLSGKVDIELPGGKVRTLKPGDLLVMAGVPHAWKNHYDEDCVYIAITIGFNK
jgi:mannose-6-phosphate isomerase-like protein (cupin superfamily)